jgi:hypothetical protein
MSMPQVGFNEQVAQTNPDDPKRVRILSLAGSAKIMRKGLSRNLSAWA